MANSERALYEFRQELNEVDACLLAAVDELASPLDRLILSQLRLTAPPIRAAFVLTAGTDGAENHNLRRQRVFLASGLEMLYVALRVHNMLVANAGDIDEQWAETADQVDRSFIGSTILAGDYGFSRAAHLVAQTDSPHVVDIFAHTLQVVSEEQLRALFTNKDSVRDYDALPQLLISGVRAALELANLSGSDRRSVLQFARQLIELIVYPTRTGADFARPDVSALPTALQDRWAALIAWLVTDLISDDRLITGAGNR